MIDVIINNQIVGTFNSIAEAQSSEAVAEAQAKCFEAEINGLPISEIIRLKPVYKLAKR